MLIDESDLVVRIVNLPTTISGFVSKSPDGMYNIYLNANHSCEMRHETYRHELEHILNGDFESDKRVWELEG